MDGNRDIDPREVASTRHQSAVEVLHGVIAHFQVERELLLDGEFAAYLEASAPRHPHRLATGEGDDPIHLADHILIEESVRPGRRQNEGALLAPALHHGAQARRETAPLEGAWTA